MIVTKPPKIEIQRLAEARLNGGVITMIDAADIPNGALQIGKNISVRFDKTSRRAGTTIIEPPKPDSNPVLGTFFVKLQDNTAFTFRFSASSIHSRGSLSWTQLVGPALAGSSVDRFQLINVLNSVIFANNGANVLHKIDPNASTYAALGNAPAYRYVTGFFNRAVGAALRDINEVEVGWCGDGVIDQWDPLVDETAGKSPILESPSDLSDYITGIFGFTNVMILMREQSIWVATKQPIPTNPFNFYAAFPGIGSNCPNTIAVIPNGLAWLDTRTNTVWAYTPGAAPEPIGRAVESTILKGIDDPQACFGSYNGKHAEYTVAIPRAGSNLVTTWSYNFRTRTWVEGEYFDITSIDDIELATGVQGLIIDDLIGTIDDLLGTIDELSPSSTGSISTRLFGKSNGDIVEEDPNTDTDAGTEFEMLIGSKIFSLPTDDSYIVELRIEFIQFIQGEIEIHQSDDGGFTYQLWRTLPFDFFSLNVPQIAKVFGPLKCRKYAWQLRATKGAFEILSFEILFGRSGESRDPS